MNEINKDKEEDNTRNKFKSRSDELKTRYRKIVKCLHPDMNPEQTETEKESNNTEMNA